MAEVPLISAEHRDDDVFLLNMIPRAQQRDDLPPVTGDEFVEMPLEEPPVIVPPPSTLHSTPAPPVVEEEDTASYSEEAEPVGEPVIRFRQRKHVEAEMDMTPMVDVTFLLLIFFMVTAAFAVQKAQETAKQEPQDGAAARSFQALEEDPDYITLHVDEYGTYRVVTVDWEREALSPSELLRLLKDARRGSVMGHVPKHLLLRAHGGATHEKVVVAHDAANAVGMDDVQLLTHEEDE